MKKAISIFISLFFANSFSLIAQEVKPEERDLTDYVKKLFPKNKIPSDTLTLESGKTTFSVIPAAGYSLTTSFAVNMAANVVFKQPNANLSSFVASPTLTTKKQILLPIRGTVWSKNNKYNWVFDWRLMKYPQSTFGIGSASKLSTEYPMNYAYLRLYQTVYKKIGGSFFVGLGYHYDNHWNVNISLPEGLKDTDIYSLGIAKKSLTSGVSLNFLFDNRANSIYPENSLYINANLRHNLALLGSNFESTTLITDTRKYINLPQNSSNVLAFWNFNWLTINGKLPFLDLPSTGWDMFTNTARGYIQGRLRGYNYIYTESEYRFNITRNKFLGAVAFANVQSVSDDKSLSFKKYLPGVGVGLRIKVNKLSKTNLGIDYGFGVEGSRGLFVNFGEVF